MDISSWQNIIFFVIFLVGKSSGQEHNFLVGWSNKCDASGPRDQSDRITQIPNRGKTNKGKSLRRGKTLWEIKFLTSFSMSECPVVGAEEGLEIESIRNK